MSDAPEKFLGAVVRLVNAHGMDRIRQCVEIVTLAGRFSALWAEADEDLIDPESLARLGGTDTRRRFRTSFQQVLRDSHSEEEDVDINLKYRVWKV